MLFEKDIFVMDFDLFKINYFIYLGKIFLEIGK